MKYKLINSQTKEKHLCDKVTIDGFDYYVVNEIPSIGDKSILQVEDFATLILTHYDACEPDYTGTKVIATNNSDIDVPKVVDEVARLAEEHCEWWEFERLLGSGSNGLAHDSFISGYHKSQETHPFSEEDIIDFYEWMQSYQDLSCALRINEVDTKGELIELWKKQRPKTVYYE